MRFEVYERTFLFLALKIFSNISQLTRGNICMRLTKALNTIVKLHKVDLVILYILNIDIQSQYTNCTNFDWGNCANMTAEEIAVEIQASTSLKDAYKKLGISVKDKKSRDLGAL